ncbi:MAG: leucine/isoleucine/valine transporter permease subunit [Syntrophorhabdaceae bacterium PtaU1.Bin034]|nr:MAG: leucine/isoleucine/valine transporter permease subunit [Syntrophorhabdaceae bacterium PtaU1.Bin034]
MNFFKGARRFLLISTAAYILLKGLFLSGLVTEYIQQITLFSLIVILASLGLNVIYGYTGQFSLGHAAFYGIGAYTSAYLTHLLSVESALPLLPILLFSGLFSALIGYLIGLPILRLRDDFLAIATLGFGILVRVLLDNSDKVAEVLGGPRGFVGISRITNLEIVFFVLVFLILITRNLIFSKYGLFWQCIKDDELASTAFGVDTGRMKSMAFTYGCFLAGVAGGLYAHLYTFLHPSNFDFLKSIDFLIIVIIGGMGSITGTILAGLLWVGFIEGLRIVLPAGILDLRWVFIPIFLIILMMWRPHGLITEKESRFLGIGKT